MKPTHTHTHTITYTFSFYPSQLFMVISPLSGCLLNTLNLSFCLPTLADRHTHTSFCYWHTRPCRKHKGSLFFNPGTKTAKCNNLGQKCWHLKMSLAFRQNARSQLKWTEATDRRDPATPDDKRKTDTPSIAIFTHCIVTGPSASFSFSWFSFLTLFSSNPLLIPIIYPCVLSFYPHFLLHNHLWVSLH